MTDMLFPNGATEALDKIAVVVGEDHIVRGEAYPDTTFLSACKKFGVAPLAVVDPASTQELSEVVKICSDAGIAMIPQGGSTGLAGGAAPRGGEVLIRLSRMRKLRDIDVRNATITVEAGMTLAEVAAAAAEENLLYPVMIGSWGSCQIGGNIATNAGGTQVLRYGNTRAQVLGLEAVLPDGRIWNGLRGLRKDSTGYDMKQLFIGSEGTIGFVTAAVLQLKPNPTDVAACFVGIQQVDDAIDLLGQARALLGESLTAFEIMNREALDLTLVVAPHLKSPFEETYPCYLLIEVAGQGEIGTIQPLLEKLLEAGHEKGLIEDAVFSNSDAQRAKLWELREWKLEAQLKAGPGVKHDISVPVSAIPEFISVIDRALEQTFPGIRLFCFGHIGDGNLHYNPIFPMDWDATAFEQGKERINRLVHEQVARMNGSISAEHGVGQLRSNEFTRYKDPVELSMMRALKAAFDPKGLMNPGKVFPVLTEDPNGESVTQTPPPSC